MTELFEVAKVKSPCDRLTPPHSGDGLQVLLVPRKWWLSRPTPPLVLRLHFTNCIYHVSLQSTRVMFLGQKAVCLFGLVSLVHPPRHRHGIKDGLMAQVDLWDLIPALLWEMPRKKFLLLPRTYVRHRAGEEAKSWDRQVPVMLVGAHRFSSCWGPPALWSRSHIRQQRHCVREARLSWGLINLKVLFQRNLLVWLPINTAAPWTKSVV